MRSVLEGRQRDHWGALRGGREGAGGGGSCGVVGRLGAVWGWGLFEGAFCGDPKGHRGLSVSILIMFAKSAEGEERWAKDALGKGEGLWIAGVGPWAPG